MTGFLMPKHDEIMRGLVELGVSPDRALADLRAALDSPDGKGAAQGFDEPSGRLPGNDFGADAAFSRDVVTDDPTLISNQVHYQVNPDKGKNSVNSEFLRPWAYPLANQAGAVVGGERNPSHPGPWLQGDRARSLLERGAGDADARAAFERAATPDETESEAAKRLPNGQHLGNPIDYSLYLVGRLTSAPDAETPALPDFNLDSDRGYAYRCWDWNRRTSSLAQQTEQTPDGADAGWRYETSSPTLGSLAPDLGDRFSLLVPCTPPQGYKQVDSQGNPINLYDPNVSLKVHYLDGIAYDPGFDPTGPGQPLNTPTAGGLGPVSAGPLATGALSSLSLDMLTTSAATVARLAM
jgi:hypothetical protein